MTGKRNYIYSILLIIYLIVRETTPSEYHYLVTIFTIFMFIYIFFSDRIFDWFKKNILKD